MNWLRPQLQCKAQGGEFSSLEPSVSVPGFVLQLREKNRSKAARQNLEQKRWVRGIGYLGSIAD